MAGRDSLTCISNNGPSLNWCWLVSPIKEGGNEGLPLDVCTKQLGCLSSYTNGKGKERRKKSFKALS